MICANKIDLVSFREVSRTKGEHLAEKTDALYF